MCGPALYLVALDFFVQNLYVDPGLCGIARDHGPVVLNPLDVIS
jgi:hypothetical protein